MLHLAQLINVLIKQLGVSLEAFDKVGLPGSFVLSNQVRAVIS